MNSLEKNFISIFTKARNNMKEKIITPIQKSILKKRGLIETVIGQLKNICQIEHSRHRSPTNAFANMIAGLIAYQFKKRKPNITISDKHVLSYGK